MGRTQITIDGMPLREAAFVTEYLVDLNATAAAIRAGYEPQYAQQTASKLLKPGSRTANGIARAMAARSVRVGISQDRVLMELGRIAFGDPRAVFNEDGSLKKPHEMNDDDGAMIEGVKTRRIVEVGIKPDGSQGMVPVEIQEVKLVSKTAALGMVMRHLGMNNDKLDVNVTSLASRLDEATRRVGRGGEEALRTVLEGVVEEVVEAERIPAADLRARVFEAHATDDEQSADDFLAEILK